MKIERCVRYMIARLPEDDIAPHLWTTLAGRPLRAGRMRGAARTEALSGCPARCQMASRIARSNPST
ncbi:hypothetical protein GCM10017771_59260 [Streptomyces capitiformicae]|uniref:Uncharacterized protein n=1 Tax=Streptomyces capitiformicae TaxID=2014920 RepID=A0A919DF15_9ACTN|nr:hypothetical protein GCM10017771_59260 [Streptomyces capitiformicae]